MLVIKHLAYFLCIDDFTVQTLDKIDKDACENTSLVMNVASQVTIKAPKVLVTSKAKQVTSMI